MPLFIPQGDQEMRERREALEFEVARGEQNIQDTTIREQEAEERSFTATSDREAADVQATDAQTRMDQALYYRCTD